MRCNVCDACVRRWVGLHVSELMGWEVEVVVEGDLLVRGLGEEGEMR